MVWRRQGARTYIQKTGGSGGFIIEPTHGEPGLAPGADVKPPSGDFGRSGEVANSYTRASILPPRTHSRGRHPTKVSAFFFQAMGRQGCPACG